MSKVKPLRDKHADATRAGVLAAARRLFARHGYAATSIDQIAEAARVTKGAVYHHFDDKRALFRAVYEEIAQQVEQRVRRRLEAASGPLDRARLGLDAFLECADDEEVRAVMFRDGLPVLTGECRLIDERYYLGLLRELLDELAAAALVRGIDTTVLARLFLSVLIEASHMIGAADDVPAARRSVKAALERILAGLLISP